MENQTIGDIYANNEKIREKTKQLAASLSEAQTTNMPEDGQWTFAAMFEHIAIVQDGMTKITAKLLNEAKASEKNSNGEAILTEEFRSKAAAAQELKLQAPEQVVPTGKMSIAESLAKMDETQKTLEEMRPLFETVECSDFKFPHPFMGKLNAHEWLTLIGGHEARHLRQLAEMLEQSKS